MKTYTLFWLYGHSEIITGLNPTSAMTNAGYSQAALRALDFYVEGNRRRDYQWDLKTRNWNRTG